MGYLRVGQLTTGRKIEHGEIILAGVPGTGSVTPTRLSQLCDREGNRLLYPEVPILFGLGDSGTVAAQVAPLLLSGIRSSLEASAADAKATLIDRVKPFLSYAAQRDVLPQKLYARLNSNAVEGLLEKEVTALTKAVYGLLKREAGATSSVKEGIRDYILGSKVAAETLKFLANKIPQFGKPAGYGAIAGELEEIGRVLQKIWDGDSAILKDLTEAVSAIKLGKCGIDKPVASLGRLQIETSGELEKLIGTKYGAYFLAKPDAIVNERAGNGAIVPFCFKAANGTNVPDELRGNYLPTQKLISAVQVLDDKLGDIAQAYLHEGENTESRGLVIKLELVLRRLMPDNPAIDIVYPENEVTVLRRLNPEGKSAVVNNPALAAEISERAAESFRSGEMARLAAKHLRIGEENLSQKGLETLVSIQNQITRILPFEFYRLMIATRRKAEVEEKLDYYRQTIKNEMLVREFTKEFNSLVTEGNRMRQILRGEFGVAKVLDYRTEVEAIINLFGEGIGFIRNIKL